MEYYDLFMDGPSVYIPVLVLSLLITVAVYCAFPLLYAKIRRKPITASKYRVHCFLVNFLIMLVFKLVTAGSSASPYFLWTTVFTYSGVKNLRSRGMILDQKSAEYAGKYTQNVESDASIVDISAQPVSEISAPAVAPAKPKKTKSRFCKLCGNPIDPATKKCTGCGKQYFRLPSRKGSSLVWKVVAVLSVIAVCLCIYRITQLETRLSDMQSLATEQEAKIAELSKTGESLQKRIAEKSSKVSSLTNDINTLKRKNEKMEKVYNFCNNHVVVVSDDGTRKYHKIQCIYFDDSYFWAYNLEAAQQKGYQPCSFCFSRYFDSLGN